MVTEIHENSQKGLSKTQNCQVYSSYMVHIWNSQRIARGHVFFLLVSYDDDLASFFFKVMPNRDAAKE